MAFFSTSILALVTAASSAPTHWRSGAPNATDVYITGTHLSYNTAPHITHDLSTRAVWLQQEYIDAHNNERASHGANALVWDDSLSASAQAWSNQCKFEHSQAGENLAAGTGGPTPATAVGWWNAESGDYDPSNPQASHWTQVVWKSTTRFGCAMTQCAAGTIFPVENGVTNYFVCHYDPVGNVIGQFPENVQK